MVYKCEISGKIYEGVLISRNLDIAQACLEGLQQNKYDAILFGDRVKKETVYRVVVRK